MSGEGESSKAIEVAPDADRPRGALSRLAVPLVVLGNLVVTLLLAQLLNIWVDESFSLNTTGQGIAYSLRQSINFELQAPFYFVLLSILRKIDTSVFAARAFSVLCIALTVRVSATLSRRFFPDVHPAWIAALVAFNPYIIAMAVDIRLYALVVLETALLLLLFYDAYLTDGAPSWKRVCFILLAIAGLYTQYYVGFLLFANAFVLLVLKRRRALIAYLAAMALVAICFLPMVPYIRTQLSAHSSPVEKTMSILATLKFITWRIKDYVLPAAGDTSLAWRSWILRFMYFIGICVLIQNRNRLRERTSITLWTIAIVVAVFFCIAVRFTGESLMEPRHTAVFLLPVLLWAFSIAALEKRKAIILGFVLVSFAFYGTYLYGRYKPMAKYGDWQRVATYLMTQERPGQAILVFHGGAALPLSHYYRGPNVIAAVPRENTFEKFDFRNYVLHDQQEIVDTLARTPGENSEIWLVTDNDCGFEDLSYNCPILEQFVAEHYVVEDTKQFRGSKVRRLRRIKRIAKLHTN